MTPRSLPEVLGELYESEINAGISTFWDDGVTVWLGDGLNGLKAERSFHRAERAKAPDTFKTWPGLWTAAAEWLHQEALRHYPHSDYAKRHVW